MTYKGLIHVFTDVCDDVSVVTAGEDGVQGVLLDGVQETCRVAQPQHLHLAVGQPLHQVVHGNVGWSTTQHLANSTGIGKPYRRDYYCCYYFYFICLFSHQVHAKQH